MLLHAVWLDLFACVSWRIFRKMSGKGGKNSVVFLENARESIDYFPIVVSLACFLKKHN